MRGVRSIWHHETRWTTMDNSGLVGSGLKPTNLTLSNWNADCSSRFHSLASTHYGECSSFSTYPLDGTLFVFYRPSDVGRPITIGGRPMRSMHRPEAELTVPHIWTDDTRHITSIIEGSMTSLVDVRSWNKQCNNVHMANYPSHVALESNIVCVLHI